jgi:tRNA U55 pseudouridine synthase TruB
VTLEELSEAASSGNVEKYILPLDWVLQDFPKLELSKKETLRYTQGKTVLAELSAFGERTVSEGDEIALYYMGNVFAVATAEPFEEKILLKTNKFFGVDI